MHREFDEANLLPVRKVFFKIVVNLSNLKRRTIKWFSDIFQNLNLKVIQVQLVLVLLFLSVTWFCHQDYKSFSQLSKRFSFLDVSVAKDKRKQKTKQLSFF